MNLRLLPLIALLFALNGVLVLDAPLKAQEPWEGDESMLVVVTDERGQPVSGVLVVLLYGDEGLRGPSLTTDRDGSASVDGLAAGEWQVDVRRESFMLVTTYLRLEADKDPEVAFSSRQRTGSYWAPLNAVFLPPGTDVTAAVAAGTRSPKAAAKQKKREDRLAAKSAERDARRFRRGNTARVVTPVASAATETQASRGQERAAPKNSRVEGPRLPTNPNLLPSGACRECREGEWSVSTSVRASAAEGASCPTPQWLNLSGDLESEWTGSLTEFAGGLASDDDYGALRLLPDAVRSSLDSRFGDWLERESSCSAVAVVLPAGSQYIGFRYQAGERATVAECLLGKDCQIGEARFVSEPEVVTHDGFVLVGTVFENRSTARARVGRLTVYFAPPSGWLPAN